MKTIVPFLATLLVGCATTRQEMSAPPAATFTVEWKGAAPAGPVVLVGTAQIGLTARPVGIDAVNPLISAAPNVNSPNSTADSGGVNGEKQEKDKADEQEEKKQESEEHD